MTHFSRPLLSVANVEIISFSARLYESIGGTVVTDVGVGSTLKSFTTIFYVMGKASYHVL